MAAWHRAHLVDASPYVFRAFFSVPTSLVGPDGAPVNAVHGFASFLLKLVDDEKPTHLAVAFDGSLTASFRNELYAPYKAQRELPPAELEAQYDACMEVARALGAHVAIDDRFEADDLIATWCQSLVRRGHGAVVVTSDKDLAQLVGERVELLDFARGERFDPAAVKARFGVRPDQIREFLGLAGDAVDNIPGVAGVGQKTAAALLAAFDDLDALYADLARVAELELRGARTLAAKLEAGRELAFLSRELATLSCKAPAKAGLRDLAFRGADPALVDPLFERLGFQRLRERIRRWR